MAEVAPYGGLLTKTIEDEKTRIQKLKEQAIEITVNNSVEVLRPNVIHARGVDSLSTKNITLFVDYYINYIEVKDENGEVSYEEIEFENGIPFKVQWINDSEVNLVFQTHEQAYHALEKLSITLSNPNIIQDQQHLDAEQTLKNPELVAQMVQERESKPYNSTIAFQKSQDLGSRLGQKVVEEAQPLSETPEVADVPVGMDEDQSSVVLYLRFAFESDKKVSNAAMFSRYYLLHGEPDRRHYGRINRGGRRNNNNYREREPREVRKEVEEPEEDLFASKLGSVEQELDAVINSADNQPVSEDRRHRAYGGGRGRGRGGNRGGRERRKSSSNNRRGDQGDDLFAHKLRDRSPERR